MTHLLKLSATLLLATTISGCAVATAGLKKNDERTFTRSINDVSAGRVIEARMNRAYDFKLSGIDVEVAEGVVLLSGNVPTQEDKIEATRIAWSAKGVEQVGNEILIRGKQGFIRNAKDGILEKSVRTRLLADKLVKGRNFNVETHEGIVYIMGVARTDAELKRAAQIAATTRGARQVISYAQLADLPAGKRLELQKEADRYRKPQVSTPQYSAPQPSQPEYSAPQPYTPQPAQPIQRELPPILQSTPDIQPAAPIYTAPLNEPIPFNPPAAIASAPAELNMGDRLGKELPTDEELGSFRTGQAGEAVSIIESAPYYVDPDTGEEIPIRYDANGNLIPQIIK